MVGSQSHGHMVLKLCCQADLQMEMYYLTWAPSWALHQALVNQTGRPDKAIDNYYKIRWETVSRKNTPSKNPSSWREDKLLQLTDSIQNIYQVSQHLKKEGKLFWQVLKTSASWSFDFIPLYYVKGKLQCIYTLAGYQVAHRTRVWVSAFTLNSWIRGREELSGAVTSKLNTAITHRDFAFQKAYHWNSWAGGSHESYWDDTLGCYVWTGGSSSRL